MTLSGVLATADVLFGYIDRVIKANKTELADWFIQNNLDYDAFSIVWADFYKTYQVATSLQSIASNLKDSNTIQLLYDGLGGINTYMSESSEFTKEQIENCNVLREQLKTLMSNEVIY